MIATVAKAAGARDVAARETNANARGYDLRQTLALRRLDISGHVDGETMTLTWAETGGPHLTEAPVLSGFGSKMMFKNLAGQLGGSIDYDWQPGGLVATLPMSVSALAN